MDISPDDILEIEECINKVQKIAEKYGLTVDTDLIYLTIFNNKKYPSDIIKQKQSFPKFQKFKNERQDERFKGKFNDKKLPYLSNYSNIDSALKFYLNQSIQPTKSKRNGIYVKTILLNFSKWYNDMYNEKIIINNQMYGKIHNILNELGIKTKGTRISGYEFLMPN